MIDICSRNRIRDLGRANALMSNSVISIVDSNTDSLASLHELQFIHIGHLLELAFEDETDETSDGDNLITKNQAEQILNFSYDHIDEILNRHNTFYVTCEGGVSRSPAIAAAIITCLAEGYDDWFIFNNPKYCPNRYVYETILKAGGVKINKAIIDSKFKKNEAVYFANFNYWY